MEIIEKLEKREFEKNSKKNQIVLTHTARDAREYAVSLSIRMGGKYSKIPHYLITREGKVIRFLEDDECSKYFYNDSLNKKSIVICLENLGWLEKEPLKNHHINWIGNIYKEKVVDRKWRDYFFWQPYTEDQYIKTAELCKELNQKYKINLSCVGHNTKVKGVESFLGILTKSNFDEFCTDLSPAFDFEKFIKLLKDE